MDFQNLNRGGKIKNGKVRPVVVNFGPNFHMPKLDRAQNIQPDGFKPGKNNQPVKST